ncbi:MAG: SCO family protein [Fidelibacterota bacterium]
MKQMYRAFCPVLFLTGLLTLSTGQAVNDSLPELMKIDVVENSGDQIPLGLSFTNTRNESVSLQDYFSEGVPVLMVLAYSDCPMLCSLVLDGLYEGVRQMDRIPGDGYRILTVSIDPKESTDTAARKQKLYLDRFPVDVSPESWDFLVGEQSQIDELANALGFKYYFDERLQQYAHPAVVFVMTGEGHISRYHFGLEYPGRDLKFSLIDASKGKIGTVFDKLVLYCFHYDPDAKGYVLFASNLMKLAGAVTLVAVVLILGSFWIYERKKEKNSLKGYADA